MRHGPSSPTLTNRGSVITLGVTIVGLLVSSAAGVYILKTGLAPYRPVPVRTPQPHASAPQLRVLLNQLGLGAENLAAAGVAPLTVGTLVTDVATDLQTSFAAISEARDSLSRAKVAKEALVRAVQSGQATPEQRNAYSGAIITFRTATTDLQSLMDGLWSRATASLTQAQRQSVQTIRANASWDLSTQYLAGNRPEADWVQLRDAWSADRFARSRQEQTPAAAAAILDAVNNDAAVSTAASNLTSLASVRAAWEAAVVANGDLP